MKIKIMNERMVKKAIILITSIFAASFLYYLMAPKPPQKDDSPISNVTNLPQKAANSVREVLGLEVPQAELNWMDYIKSTITLRNVMKVIAVIVAVVIIYRFSGGIWSKAKGAVHKAQNSDWYKSIPNSAKKMKK